MSRYLDHEVWLVCDDVLGLVGASTAIVHSLKCRIAQACWEERL